MTNKTPEKTDNQRKVFAFLKQHFESRDPFTKEQLQSVTDWTEKSLKTYWSKQLKHFVVSAGGKTYRLTEAFEPFATWPAFRKHVTQVRRVYLDYTRLRHDSLLIFEFFMPLTNETQLRATLDDLFYKDTVLRRLRMLDPIKLEEHFSHFSQESDSAYFARLCTWLEKRFGGYSVSMVSGRFRSQTLLTIKEAAELEVMGDRYLIDETTAIVRFIFPCGEPVKIPLGIVQNLEAELGIQEAAAKEADQIRWFFDVLFVQSIIQVVNGEAEIWMVESGLRNRLHIWRVESV